MTLLSDGNEHRNFNNPPIWIPLFEITVAGETFYLTPNFDTITVDGHDYTPFPITLDELVEDGQGEVSTVKLALSTIDNTLSTAIKRATSSIEGQPVLFKQYSVGRASVVYEERLEIVKVGPITVTAIILELGTFNPFLIQLLQEKFMRDFCWNRYKGKGCWIASATGGYISPASFVAGSLDSCNHKLLDCRRHNNVLRMNSCPGIPGGGAYV